jgi:hypothetical protein
VQFESAKDFAGPSVCKRDESFASRTARLKTMCRTQILKQPLDVVEEPGCIVIL